MGVLEEGSHVRKSFAQNASTMPSAPPAAPSTRLSASSWRYDRRARPAPSAESHGQFLPTLQPAHEQQIRDVRTPDQEDRRRRRRGPRQAPASHHAGDRPGPDDREAHAGPASPYACRIRRVGGAPPQLSRTLSSNAVAAQRGPAEVVRPGRTRPMTRTHQTDGGLARPSASIKGAFARGSVRSLVSLTNVPLKPLWGDADNDDRPPIDRDGTANDVRIA